MEDALQRNEDPKNREEGWNLHGVEAETEQRTTAPPVLPMEHPWVNRTAEEFWDELQDEVLMDTASNVSNEVGPRQRPKRADFMDLEDPRRQPRTRD